MKEGEYPEGMCWEQKETNIELSPYNESFRMNFYKLASDEIPPQIFLVDVSCLTLYCDTSILLKII